jgi:hypothetical protein
MKNERILSPRLRRLRSDLIDYERWCKDNDPMEEENIQTWVDEYLKRQGNKILTPRRKRTR